MKINEFFINFGEKVLYYIFVIDFLVGAWRWINTYENLDYYTDINIFLTILPIVFIPSLAKMMLRNVEKRDESIKLFDVIYGIFIWILTLILGLTLFNILSLLTIIIIMFIIYNAICIIVWYYYPRLLLTLIIPFIVINSLIIFYFFRLFSQGIEYYKTITIIELILGIITLGIVASLFICNEVSEIIYIFHL